MRFRLVALIVLVLGLSRLALSAETQSVRAEPVKRTVIKQKAKHSVRKQGKAKAAWRRVTRRRPSPRPKAVAIPLVLPEPSLPIASTGSASLPEMTIEIAASRPQLPGVNLPNQEVRALARSRFRGSFAPPAVEPKLLPARPAYWTAASITAEYRPRMGTATRDVAFGDPRFLQDQQYRIRVAFRL